MSAAAQTSRHVDVSGGLKIWAALTSLIPDDMVKLDETFVIFLLPEVWGRV